MAAKRKRVPALGQGNRVKRKAHHVDGLMRRDRIAAVERLVCRQGFLAKCTKKAKAARVAKFFGRCRISECWRQMRGATQGASRASRL